MIHSHRWLFLNVNFAFWLQRDIATQSQNAEHYTLIMDTLWNRLDEPAEKWRKVYKALILLGEEKFLFHGAN